MCSVLGRCSVSMRSICARYVVSTCLDVVGTWLVCGWYVVGMSSVCGWYVVGMSSVCGWHVVGRPTRTCSYTEHHQDNNAAGEKELHCYTEVIWSLLKQTVLPNQRALAFETLCVYCIQATLSKADTLGTKATVRFREVSALRKFSYRDTSAIRQGVDQICCPV